MKRVSIKDIARLANVSHPTVSRALHGSPLVSSETATRIRRIANEHGYSPSAVARSLATSKTNTVGIVVTTIADPFVAEVVSGIEEAAHAHDFSVLLAESNADPQREIEVVRSLEERRVDGIIVMASRVGSLYVHVLAQMRIPVVLLNSHQPGDFSYSVRIANFEASRQAVRHLLDLGHKRVGYIGDKLGHASDSERFSGYRATLDTADVPFDPEIVVHGDGTPEGGASSMQRLLQIEDPPTAVFCYNDMTAIGAMKSIRAAGLRVPSDVSLVGFDDLLLAQYTDPPLTTMQQPKQEMGRVALETIFRLLSSAEAERSVLMPGRLIVRQSTAVPAAAQQRCSHGQLAPVDIQQQ